jgi:hypothetical protein
MVSSANIGLMSSVQPIDLLVILWILMAMVYLILVSGKGNAIV